ncbi:uncharacterized protein HMPREF1541_02715 [Cyphellophora europaea CBS 101466]|uniref:Spo7-like protein n=1 Tax=Cyphellophora europaea (strain CBS 101466) TaxID=1220924 RepID=W2S4C4_CYPE1|nr:uncharacterized protein HMPREF1541_02715 [Cyphellophora europaea CBS 101466]ETN43556.1 hypothetical protein HMPREF1541_02715 [Cyphellophora europaea CBS 101466]
MPSETSLNQLVKGAPTASVNSSPPAPLPPLAQAASNNTTDQYSSDLSALPSSPPQIYLNLLILESSLRSQYLHLLSRRRLNTFFTLSVTLWNAFFLYALFLRPREDGVGIGGSIYWVIEVSEKLALMGGLVTALLIWATGQWERGVRWPRRWLSTTNRGLRVFNLRSVILRRKWYREWLGHLSFLIPFGLLWSDEGGGFSDWHFVEHENGVVIEEDLAKGGDYIMLLLQPKAFSPEFRENWEEYRSEYWAKENERRAALRKKVKLQRRTKAKEMGGWKWHSGLWRLMPRAGHRRHNQDLEKHPTHLHGHHAPHTSHQSHQRGSSRTGLSEKDALKQSRRRSLRSDSASHSRQSSRSSTPTVGECDGASDLPRVRRGSSVSSTASVRRKTRGERVSPLTSTTTGAIAEGQDRPRRKRIDRDAQRPTTPDSDSGVGEGAWKIKKEGEGRMGGVA